MPSAPASSLRPTASELCERFSVLVLSNQHPSLDGDLLKLALRLPATAPTCWHLTCRLITVKACKPLSPRRVADQGPLLPRAPLGVSAPTCWFQILRQHGYPALASLSGPFHRDPIGEPSSLASHLCLAADPQPKASPSTFLTIHVPASTRCSLPETAGLPCQRP